MNKTTEHQELADSINEIELCIWRAQDARGSLRDEHLEELDSEIMSLMSGREDVERVVIMHQVVGHLEKQDGMDPELIEEVFTLANISKEDLDAYRLSEKSPEASSGPIVRRRV